MLRFFSITRFALFFLLTPLFLFSSELEDWGIDIEAIKNEKNLENQIDTFINIGIKYQQITGKKFQYTKILKKTYRLLKKDYGISIPKGLKKDIRKRIQRRIEERFLQSEAPIASVALSHNWKTRSDNNLKYNDARDADYYGYTDGYRLAVFETCAGAVLVLVPCAPIQCVGAGLLQHGAINVWEETTRYRSENRSSRDNYHDDTSNGRREERDRFSKP